MDEDAQEKGPRRLIPSLSGVKSEYKRLCDELGGPADIGVAIKKSTMEIYCREYPSHRLLPIFLIYHPDESLARRHWPWAAMAISQYKFEQQERKKYTDEPKPEEILELLAHIKQSAHDLASGLCRLQELSDRLSDPTAPLRRPHLSWLDAMVSQAAAGRISKEVNDDELLAVHLDKMNFLKRLADIEVAVKAALKHADRTLLKRDRSQSEPALRAFVLRCGRIWKSLTGRKPSANKVHHSDRTDPDFVVFARALARVGEAPEPTRNQVAICIRNLTPATTGENSS